MQVGYPREFYSEINLHSVCNSLAAASAGNHSRCLFPRSPYTCGLRLHVQVTVVSACKSCVCLIAECVSDCFVYSIFTIELLSKVFGFHLYILSGSFCKPLLCTVARAPTGSRGPPNRLPLYPCSFSVYYVELNGIYYYSSLDQCI